jgi:iron-sulfur cluster repair protein YtfE (RIC family)
MRVLSAWCLDEVGSTFAKDLTMDVSAARKKLVAQHDCLRAHLDRCSGLARRLRCGERVHLELDAALADLRLDFADHNQTETALVRPLLHDSPNWGALLVDRMLEEHVAEHAAFWKLLAGTAADVAAHMDELVDELDAHMAAEERTFLSPAVLRSDVIARHRQETP